MALPPIRIGGPKHGRPMPKVKGKTMPKGPRSYLEGTLKQPKGPRGPRGTSGGY